MDAFLNRSTGYTNANQRNPKARWNERAAILERADLKPEHMVCDLQAASGYLADGIVSITGNAQNVVCVEPSASLAEKLATRYETVVCELEKLPIQDNKFDRVLCLAGLHHSSSLSDTISEACRILKPGGVVVLSDVEIGSSQDRWLNDIVHNNTTTGHDGKFLKLGQLSQELRSLNITVDHEDRVSVPWQFASKQQMVEFMKELFTLSAMTSAQVEEALYDCFKIEESTMGVKLNWSLIYSKGIK